MSLEVARGTFLTSHIAECPDVAPECATTLIPPHEHHVALGLTHTELSVEYGLRPGAQISFRLPYDVKAQRVRYSTLGGGPFTPPYGDIHHRSETLTGISDASVELDFSPREHWLFGAGISLPIGHIVPDPIVLGREGIKHEHLQFGSGTFEPKLTAQWSNARFAAGGEARLSLYVNREGFRAPSTFAWSAGPNFSAGRFAITPRLTGQFQSIGRWSGVADEGSGFRSGGIRLQISTPIRGVIVAPGVYRELWSHGLNREAGETFRQETTWNLSLSRTF